MNTNCLVFIIICSGTLILALRTTRPPKESKKNVLNKRVQDKNKQAKRNPTKIIARSETPSSRDVELEIGNYTITAIENGTTYESDPECGLRLSSYIVGGSNATEGSYPWMAGLLGFSTFLAGAVVIDEWWVLTAAHSFEGPNPDPIFYSIRVGSVDRTKGQTFKTEYILVHENYNENRLQENDIALIKIKGGPMKWGPGLHPVCLPEQINQPPKGDSLIATGWGFQDSKVEKFARILQQVQLNIYPLEECLLAYKTYLKREVFNTQICTFQEEQDTCQGDSGGPLIELINGKGSLVALVSYGVGCAAGFPGINTRVSHYLEWIHKMMKRYE